MKKRVSGSRIVKNDYGAFITVALIPTVLIAGLICSVMPMIVGSFLDRTPQWPPRGGLGFEATFSLVAAGTAVALALLLGWLARRRIETIRRIIRTGEKITGRINRVKFQGAGGYVRCHYEYNGKAYAAVNSIAKNSQTKQLRAGDEVMLYVDPEKPSRAFLAILYG